MSGELGRLRTFLKTGYRMKEFHNRDFQKKWDIWRYLKREIFVAPFKFRRWLEKAKGVFLE
jgi:hypothetical protein